MASDEKSFKNVDDGRMTDTSIYYKLIYELSAQVRLIKYKRFDILKNMGVKKIFRNS